MAQQVFGWPHMKALESSDFLRQKAGVAMDFGAFPRERMSPANKALIGPKSGAAIALSQRQFGSFTRYTDPRNAGRYSSCSGTKGASHMF
jgi:hypothetical protein